MEVPQKIKNKTTIWSSNPTSGYISKRIQIKVWKRNSHSCVYCGTVHNSNDMGLISLSTYGWMSKENVVYVTKERILSCPKKEGNPIRVSYNMDEPSGHYAKRNKSVPEGQILLDSSYVRFLKQSNQRSRENNGGRQGLGAGRNGELLCNGHKASVTQGKF